jgi:hypothetical protein
MACGFKGSILGRNAGDFVNGFKKLLTAGFMAAATLFTGAAQAMTFQQFDDMEVQDALAYTDFLVKAAQKVLIDLGQRNLAAKVYQLSMRFIPAT